MKRCLRLQVAVAAVSATCWAPATGFSLRTSIGPTRANHVAAVKTRTWWTESDCYSSVQLMSSAADSTLELEKPRLEHALNETDCTLTASLPDKSPETAISASVPSVKRILSFCIPAVGVWLCGPLLSMIDTSTVGLFAGTAQQAALNPAVAVSDYGARTMAFLYIGTTNMVAALAAQEKRPGDMGMAKIFQGSIQLSLLVGAGLGGFLFLFAGPLLRGLIGNNAVDPQVFAAAMKYVRIRALSMPAAAVIGTAQAASLGMQDIQSPLLVTATAAVVNLILDLALVRNQHAWIGGAAGAAWATLFSQYFAMALFFKWLNGKSEVSTVAERPRLQAGRVSSIMPLRWRLRRDSNKPRRTSPSSRGVLAGRLSWRSLFRLPDPEIWMRLKSYVIPVTTTQVGRCSAYVAMGHTVSSSFGTISMAANQIVTSIFYSLIPIADSLSQTAQSFLPGLAAHRPGPEKARALRQTQLNLLKVAAACGAFLAGIVAFIPLASGMFTSDLAVMAQVRRIVPVLLAIFSLHGVFCGSEGILLGQSDLRFVGTAYGVYFAVVPYLMLRIKKAAAIGAPVNLRSVWNVFLGYQLVRITVWLSRVIWLQLRTEREAEMVTTNRDELPPLQEAI